MENNRRRRTLWKRAVIFGAIFGVTIFPATISPSIAASTEAKDLENARKQVMNGETIQVTPIVATGMNSASKLKGEWLELHAMMVYYYAHGQYEKDAHAAIAFAPGNAHILSTYAMSLFLRRKFTEALAVSEKALSLAPNDRRTKGINTVCLAATGKAKLSKADLLNMAKNAGDNWDLYLILMQHFAFRSEFNAKFEVMDHMVKNNPKSSFAYTRRAIEYRKADEKAKATQDSKVALKLNPHNSECLNSLAIVQFDDHKYADCISTYNTIEKIGCVFPWMLNQRAKAYFELKQFDKALVDFFRSIQAYTAEDKPTKQALAAKRLVGGAKSDIRRMFVQVAECNRQLGKLDQAISYLRCASLISPGDFDVLEVRAKVHRDQGKLDLALTELNEMVSKRPHLSTNYSDRAAVLKMLGRNDEAVSDLKKSAEMGASVKKWHFKPLPRL